MSNIFFNYKIPEKFQSEEYYETYKLIGEESPEDIAFKYYERQELYWLVLLYNKMFDPYYSWPLSNNEVELYSEKKCELLYGKNYSMAQFTEVFDELAEENLNKIEIKILKRQVVFVVLSDIQNYLRSL
jgi:hypothetical protein